VSQAKVVELNIEGNRNPALPPIVHTIRQQSKKQLNELMQTLFNNTDDALFELADRSQSDQHQEMYFDSMRMIRLHRKALATSFLRGFYDSFSAAFGAMSAEDCDEDVELDASEYELLDQDELEMTVAVSGIVSKVTSQHSLVVMQLTKRLDSLAKHSSISERSNPLGPHALSSSFADALGTLNVDIKIRIILMKLFERFVMERLGPIYESSNLALADAGVLPDLKNKPPKRARAKSSRSELHNQMSNRDNSDESGSFATELAGGGIGFSTVRSLLAGVRNNGGNTNATGFAGALGGGDQVAIGGLSLPRFEPNELIHALSQLQSMYTSDRIDLDRIPELSDVRSLLLTQDNRAKRSLGQADDDTVNFVGMLFDYILNDRNLAIPMKALIGRLQIPIIKLAIIDKTFFEKSAHPARALLNELSSAGIGWSGAAELKRDALYDKIESVVIRVLSEFSENPDIFTELLSELRQFVSKDSRRSVLVEQRVKESEAGKAKTHDAKLKVQTLVNQKACGLRLPSEAGKFISEIWTRVLTLRMIKQGGQSSSWTKGVATLDDLLWSLQPLSDLIDVEKRETCTPDIVGEVAAGMQELGCPAEEIGEFSGWLADHLSNLSANDRAYLVEDERPELNIAEETLEEIILASPPVLVDVQTIPESCTAEIRKITEGTWVEVSTSEERTLRCKLATITQPGDNYIFVNRRGMKVLEHSYGELAVLIEEEKLKRIDESQVFDRALQSVIGNLRQLQRDRT